ncbi:MAG: NUDIX domain-containing protein [Clostridiales bacterium]|nr:NUDIX domain-containing protein [Clostridiales bacterium]
MDYIKYIRKMVGHKPIFLVGAGTIILNQQNQMLLMKRSDNLLWSTLGGSLNLGETFEQAAIREAYEEANITISNLKLYKIVSGEQYKHTYPNGDQVYNACAVFYTYDYIGKLEIDNDETLELKFFKMDQLPKKLNPPDKIYIKQFISEFTKGKIK